MPDWIQCQQNNLVTAEPRCFARTSRRAASWIGGGATPTRAYLSHRHHEHPRDAARHPLLAAQQVSQCMAPAEGRVGHRAQHGSAPGVHISQALLPSFLCGLFGCATGEDTGLGKHRPPQIIMSYPWLQSQRSVGDVNSSGRGERNFTSTTKVLNQLYSSLETLRIPIETYSNMAAILL